jgi:hypothetical protein
LRPLGDDPPCILHLPEPRWSVPHPATWPHLPPRLSFAPHRFAGAFTGMEESTA